MVSIDIVAVKVQSASTTGPMKASGIPVGGDSHLAVALSRSEMSISYLLSTFQSENVRKLKISLPSVSVTFSS